MILHKKYVIIFIVNKKGKNKMYLAVLAKTDGRLSGFVPSNKSKDLGIEVYSHEVSTNLIAGYFCSKNEIPDDYVAEMICTIESDERIKEIEIMKYIERYE